MGKIINKHDVSLYGNVSLAKASFTALVTTKASEGHQSHIFLEIQKVVLTDDSAKTKLLCIFNLLRKSGLKVVCMGFMCLKPKIRECVPDLLPPPPAVVLD